MTTIKNNKNNNKQNKSPKSTKSTKSKRQTQSKRQTNSKRPTQSINKYKEIVAEMRKYANPKEKQKKPTKVKISLIKTAKLRKQLNDPIPQTQLYLTPKHIPIPLVDSNMVEAFVNQQLPPLNTLVANITYEQYVKFMEVSTKKCIPYHNLIRNAISLMKYIVTHFTNYEKSDALTKETKTLIQNLSTNYFSSNLSSILITNLFNDQIEQSVDDICKKMQTLNEAEFNLLKSFFIDYLFNLKEIGKNIEMNKFITLVNSYIESFNQYNQLLYSI